MDNEQIQERTSKLLHEIGCRDVWELEPVRGGGNNKVFAVRIGPRTLFLKVYFRHEKDTRDRLNAEFSFCRFAWAHGLRCLPEPLACDREAGIGLYEFIEGRKIAPGEVTRAAVEQALDFYAELNRHRAAADAQSLPAASEACFSLAEHLRTVSRRVEHLGTVAPDSAIHREAVELIRERLLPIWSTLEHSIRRSAEAAGVRPDDALAPGDRRLSPSDFGFHNALLTADGRFRFIDFEYAGWDDPAKTVGDFFAQVAVPVPRDFIPLVTDGVLAGRADAAAWRERIRLLLPVYQVKWCCIVLNDFLPTDFARRRFADVVEDEERRKRHQLDKAASLLDNIMGMERGA